MTPPCSPRSGCSYLARSSRVSRHSDRGRAVPRFLAPGILAQSVLFIAIFYGIAVIWERDLGVIHKCLWKPHSARRARARQGPFGGRTQPVPGRHRLHLALLLGVRMNWNPLALLGVTFR